MRQFELMPNNGQKSFYGKAIVMIDNDGTQTLYSYNTPIIRKPLNGPLVRLWDGWSATTGKHIKSFCGLNKAEFLAVPFSPALQHYKDMITKRNIR